MKTLHFTKTMDAPKEKVWNTMLEDKTYREWTSAFNEGSYYEGSWEKGSKILFLGPEGSGMVSVIAENRPYEFISIKHIGLVNKGVEDTESEDAKKWAPAFENYTFTEADRKTTISVEMDILEEYEEMFQKMWPKALRKLKELSEK
ncbi:MAG TPA: SRPBCC domain-containing protein [Salinimicrobium sp.]|nr:SRPBCC domain-containing protein [Salinimicrobium sp.]